MAPVSNQSTTYDLLLLSCILLFGLVTIVITLYVCIFNIKKKTTTFVGLRPVCKIAAQVVKYF